MKNSENLFKTVIATMITFAVLATCIYAISGAILARARAAKADEILSSGQAIMPLAGEATNKGGEFEDEESSAQFLVDLYNKAYSGFELGDKFLFDELQRAYHEKRWDGSVIQVSGLFDFENYDFEKSTYNAHSTIQMVQERYARVWASVQEDGTLTVREKVDYSPNGEQEYDPTKEYEVVGVYNVNFPQAYLLDSIPEDCILVTEDGVFTIQGRYVRLDRLPADGLNLTTNGTCRWEVALPEECAGEVSLCEASASDGIFVTIEDYLGNASQFYSTEAYGDWELVTADKISCKIYEYAARHFLG